MKKRNKPITLLKPVGGKEELDALKPVIESGWWGKGPKVAEFEKRFSEYVMAGYATAVTSNTHALDLILKIRGIQNSTVISPTMSFATTAIVPMWNNNKSVLVDVEKDSMCIDPDEVKKALDKYPDTKAIIAVNMAGVPAKIDEIRSFYDGLIIEDCAHSMYVDGAGTRGDVALWSFQAVKTLPIGDGGMITHNSFKLQEELKPATWLGIKKSTFDRTKMDTPGYVWDYEIDSMGWKYYMIDILAAIGLVQLDKLKDNLEHRRWIQDVYRTELMPYVPMKAPPIESKTVQYYCARVNDYRLRNPLIQYLAEYNIHTSVHFKPLHLHPLFKQTGQEFPVADKIWKHLITLPCHPGIDNDDLDYIIENIKGFFKNEGR